MTEETVQNWLNTTYQDKNVSKIELWNKERGEPGKLTGELKIEGYTKVEEINFERWDKEKFKDEITKVTISNCPQVKKIKFNNNKITEIIFQGTFPNLGWLDLPDNKLTKVGVGKFPNLTRLNVARNPNLTEIEGWEILTKVEFVNLLNTPGLNNQKFNKWKEGINSALGLTPKDSPLPNDWENKLNDLKSYINPNDKDKLKEAAKNAGFGFSQKDIDDAVEKEKNKWKGFIDPKDSSALGKAASDQGKLLVNQDDLNKIKGSLGVGVNGTLPKDWADQLAKKNDLDDANKKVKDYENGLKDKLGLNDGNLSTWKSEIDKLKNRPASDNSDQIKGILGLKPNDPLPSDWKDKLVPKTKLDEWENVFGKGKPPADIKKELESKAAGSGTGATLTPEQQQKLNNYDRIKKQRDERPNITLAQYAKIGNFIKKDLGTKDWENEILGADWKAQIQQPDK